jgi:hypothetical protein
MYNFKTLINKEKTESLKKNAKNTKLKIFRLGFIERMRSWSGSMLVANALCLFCRDAAQILKGNEKFCRQGPTQ